MGKNYWTIWGATLLFFVAFCTLLIPFPLYLAGVGLPDWQIAVVLGALGIASIVVRPLAGIFSDTCGHRRVMLVGTGALCLFKIDSIPQMFNMQSKIFNQIPVLKSDHPAP